MIRIVLADDHTLLRNEIRNLLACEADFEIVGQASNGLLLLEVLAETPTDVVVLDLHMPAMDGLTAIRAIRQQFPQVRVLVLSMLDHEYYADQAFEAGALGYALKHSSFREIVHAIRTVHQNAFFLCTEIGLRLVDKLTRGTRAVATVRSVELSLVIPSQSQQPRALDIPLDTRAGFIL